MSQLFTCSPARLILLAALAVAACAEREVILPGQRFDTRAAISPDGPAIESPAVASVALSLPAIRGNSDWTHRGGSASHFAGHVALGAGTQQIFAAPIGQPEDRRHRITADPIVSGGLIFTLDSRARVTATSVSGGRVWSADITPAGENVNSVSGGGIATEGRLAFVTTGFGEVVALDISSGGVAWRQRLDGPVGGAPTVQNGVVYVANRNAVGFAIRASDGKVLWQVNGIPQPTGMMGVAAPAVDGDLVVFPFSSGQLLAADRETGIERWSAQVAGSRGGRAVSLVRDMTGEPVIAGNVVYAGTSSGRIGAFDRQAGVQIWSAREGALSPVLPVGGSVFAINDQSQLVRLDAATGGLIWARDLPWFTDKRIKKQDQVYAHYGPVLAGGRLFIASSDGILRGFDPATGTEVARAAIEGGAATAPVVAGMTLYVTSRDGRLRAFR